MTNRPILRRRSQLASPSLWLFTLILLILGVVVIGPSFAQSPDASGAAKPLAPAGVQVQETLYPTADAYVTAKNPTANYGTVTYLNIGRTASGYDQHILIRFDLSAIPAGATISSATLQLYTEINLAGAAAPAGAPDAAGQVWPHRISGGVAGAWIETSVTWNSQPSYLASADDAPTTVTLSNGWHDVTVTQAVKRWVEDGASNSGFLLRGDHSSTWYTLFLSRENSASVRPRQSGILP